MIGYDETLLKGGVQISGALRAYSTARFATPITIGPGGLGESTTISSTTVAGSLGLTLNGSFATVMQVSSVSRILLTTASTTLSGVTTYSYAPIYQGVTGADSSRYVTSGELNRPMMLVRSVIPSGVSMSSQEVMVLSGILPALNTDSSVRLTAYGYTINDAAAARTFVAIVRLGARMLYSGGLSQTAGGPRAWKMDFMMNNAGVTNRQYSMGSWMLTNQTGTVSGACTPETTMSQGLAGVVYDSYAATIDTSVPQMLTMAVRTTVSGSLNQIWTNAGFIEIL